MWRILLALIVLGSPSALNAQTDKLRVKPPFQPAETVSVTDIALPLFCGADGTVELKVFLTETGNVQDVEVRRDIPCLTEQAIRAVKDWKFSPATFTGQPIESRILVAVTFPPQITGGYPVSLPEPKAQTEAAAHAEFQPPQVTRAWFPASPFDAASPGTVVVESTLSARGEITDVKVVRDFPPFTAHVKAALGNWRFLPATFHGTPVRSRIVLAFVFRPLITSPPPR